MEFYLAVVILVVAVVFVAVPLLGDNLLGSGHHTYAEGMKAGMAFVFFIGVIGGFIVALTWALSVVLRY